MSRTLLSPRAPIPRMGDFGERSAFVAGQHIGRARRRRRAGRAEALGRIARRVLVTLLVVAVPAGLVAAGWWLLTSPRFAVRSVDVRGTQRLSPERILDVAGVKPGTSLFLLDPRRVVQSVQALPEVERAELIRELPNRVSIVIEERRPFTLVHAGRLHWLDESGHVLGREAQAVTPPVPVVSGLSEDELLSMPAAPTGKARDAIRLIRALLRSGSPLAGEISEIDMSGTDGPVLYTVGGVEVRLGGELWDERLARLEGVLGQTAGRDGSVRMVDLRFRDQVVLQGGR